MRLLDIEDNHLMPVSFQTPHSCPTDACRAIEALSDIPLVIHGGSGVPDAQRTALARESAICKFNIGTELRMAFGAALREAVGADPARFDRVQILKETHDPVMAATRRILAALKPA